MLKGKWLEELGFKIGDYISIACEDGRLVITPDAERAAVANAEKMFMDKGLSDHHITMIQSIILPSSAVLML
jgi:virulence-associated protein VagC